MDLFWLRETRPDRRRSWLAAYDHITGHAPWRAAINTAISTIQWYPIHGSHRLPLSTAAAIHTLIASIDTSTLIEVGTASTPVTLPEPHLIDAVRNGSREYLDPDFTVTATLLACRYYQSDGYLHTYHLDTGAQFLLVASDAIPIEHPTPQTLACGLTRHRDCPGSVAPTPSSHTRRACVCDCHGGAK